MEISQQTPRRKINRLKNKYGVGIIDDFNAVYRNPHIHTLTATSNKYGFSREYGRQLFNQIFDKPVSEIKKERPASTTCQNDPRHKAAEYKKETNVGRGAVVEKRFWDICVSMGFDVKVSCGKWIDMIINNRFVDIKSCFSLFLRGPGAKTPTYMYHPTQKQYNDADIFACYHPKRDSFFIIPNFSTVYRKRTRSIYIGETKSDKLNKKNRIWELENNYTFFL